LTVESLEFHPTMDVLCSSLTSDVTALWNLKGVMFKTFEGVKKVRFQPRSKSLLDGRSTYLIYTRTWRLLHKSDDVHHPEDINSIGWEQSGNILASVCFLTACVWTVTQGGVLTLFYKLDTGEDVRPNFFSRAFIQDIMFLLLEINKKITTWDIRSKSTHSFLDASVSQPVEISSSTNRNLIASPKRNDYLLSYRVCGCMMCLVVSFFLLSNHIDYVNQLFVVSYCVMLIN
jgi:hypothetical protein